MPVSAGGAQPAETPQPDEPAPALQQPEPAASTPLSAAQAPSYPRYMVKGDVRRQVPNEQTAVRLRFEGFRFEDEPEPARGNFLPSPTTKPAEQPDTRAQPRTGRRKS